MNLGEWIVKRVKFKLLDQATCVPLGLAKILNTVFLAIPPEVFDAVAPQVPEVFVHGHRRLDGVDALNVASGVVAGMVDGISHQNQSAG